jgi:hypothetical protein
MKCITTNVRDLGTGKRQSLEPVLGQKLHDNEQLIIQIVRLGDDHPPPQPEGGPGEDTMPQLPDWCDVYAGLSDQEIAELETAILQRANVTRR